MAQAQTPNVEDWIPGLTDIGSGYDVIRGIYADSGSLKIRLVDWKKDKFREQKVTDSNTGQSITFQIPESVSFHSTNQSNFYTVHGTSTEKYSKDLTSHTGLEGNYNFFSGSLSVDYESSETSSLSSSFTKIQHFINLYNLILPSINTFKTLLKDDVARDINDDTLKPDDLYTQYGTHFINSMAVGGRAAFTSATDSRKYTSSTSVEVAAKMSYKAVVGSITAEEKLKYKEAMESFNSSSSTRVLTTGGNSAFGDEEFPKHHVEWAKSILDYPAMEDFGPLPAFFPIWKLASAPSRSKALEEALPIYLTTHNKDLNIPPPYLTTSFTKYSLYLGELLHHFERLTIVYRPVCRPQLNDHRYFLGSLWLDDPKIGPVVVPYTQSQSALADVKSWENISDNVYRGFGPTPDYVMLGDYLSETGTPGDVKNLKTVHISCLKPATYTNPIRSSNGGIISFWEISEGGVFSGFWRASLDDSEPSVPAYVLNPKYYVTLP